MKIVCVGDSITEGAGASGDLLNYPGFLGSRLDPEQFEVVNLGCGGRTMLKKGDFPYCNEEHHQKVLESEADVIILMLGTNDSKFHNWNEAEYE